jgi:hypothetical protein
VTVWANDSAGNENSSSVTFTVDTTNPLLTIVYPLNQTYNLNVSELNYTHTETNPDSCWYSNDSGKNNYSVQDMGLNFTNVISYEGSNTWTLYCNDTVGNINSTSRTFFKDTINPLISITTPSNNTNSTNTNLDVNYTYTELNPSLCWYSNDTMVKNTTISCGSNITTVTWSEGQHNITIWINDSASNENQTSVTFRIDTTSPSVTIDEPKPQTYATNESLALNYTVTDSGVGIDSCWFKVVNSTNSIEINNQTLANCQNTTFNVSREDSYTLTLYSNDTLNNLNNDSVTFSVSLTGPAIVLDSPTDNQAFTNGTNVYFNFTATDPDGVDTCELWHNATGTWHQNYTWINPTNATQNYTTLNLTDIRAIWNVWCNDTSNNEKWALNNFTFLIDTIIPLVGNISVTTTVGSQTVTFSFNASDTNLDSCWYSVYNSSGQIDQATAANTSVSCNSAGNSETMSDYGTFTLRIYANDSAGNENFTNENFTTTASTPSGGGGGGGGAETVKVFSLVKPLEDDKIYTDVQRAILYAEINKFRFNIFGTFSAMRDKDMSDLEERLQNKGMTLEREEIEMWIQQYEDLKTQEVFVSKADKEKYDLVLATGKYCGDGICQGKTPGNDLGVLEDFFTCQEDCPGFQVETTIFYCFDNNPDTYCIWDQVKAQYIGLFVGIFVLIISFSTVQDKRTGRQIPTAKYYYLRIKRRIKQKI